MKRKLRIVVLVICLVFYVMVCEGSAVQAGDSVELSTNVIKKYEICEDNTIDIVIPSEYESLISDEEIRMIISGHDLSNGDTVTIIHI